MAVAMEPDMYICTHSEATVALKYPSRVHARDWEDDSPETIAANSKHSGLQNERTSHITGIACMLESRPD